MGFKEGTPRLTQGGHKTIWGLTLAWRREAHGLGKGGQHRLLCQPEAQPSTQGSGERAGEGQWTRPLLSNLALYTFLCSSSLPPPPPIIDPLLKNQNQLQSQKRPSIT